MRKRKLTKEFLMKREAKVHLREERDDRTVRITSLDNPQ